MIDGWVEHGRPRYSGVGAFVFFIDTCIIHLSFFSSFTFLVFFSFFPHTSLVVWGLIFIASNIRGWSR